MNKKNKTRLSKLQEKKLLCACGCGELIPITKLHLYRKIPKYKVGHSSRDNKIKERHSKTMKEKYKNGEIVPWNKGLTSATDERVKIACDNLHKKVREKYEKGELTPWNKDKKYKNPNYPKNRKRPILTKEQRKFKTDLFTGESNPNFNPNKSEFQKYKIKCKFNFDLGKYPKEFDMCKIRNMFHPFKNKDGYTRDHIFSIFGGFRLGINPKLIKHPANCKLMLHRENSRKGKWVDITEDELIININKWEEKYGIYR